MIRISCSQRVLRIFLQKFREPVEEIIIISFFLGQKKKKKYIYNYHSGLLKTEEVVFSSTKI